MKKIYSFILMFIIGVTAYSQVLNQIVPKTDGVKLIPVLTDQKLNSITKSSKGQADTIFIMDFFRSGQPVMISYPTGGWVFGVNGEKCKEIAQGFKMSLDEGYTNYSITEVLFLIGGIERKSRSDSSTLKINICEIDDSSHYGADPTNPEFNISCPGTILKTIYYPWNQGIDTLPKQSQHPYLASAPLDEPLEVTRDYAIVLNLEDYLAKGDIIGFIGSGTAGASNYNGVEYTWWKYPAAKDFWALYNDLFTNVADRALGVFPVVDIPEGINKSNFFNGLKLSQNFPNPSNHTCVINYELKNAGKVTLEVFNSTGKIMARLNEGSRSAGAYSINLDITKYPAGNYYYSLITDNNNRMTRKMIVVK